MNNARTILPLIVLFVMSCNIDNLNSSYNKKDLSLYFETNNIEVERIDTNKLELYVKNSELMYHEKEDAQIKWETSETYASMGALILSSQITDENIDTVVVKLLKDDLVEKYQYSLNALRDIEKYEKTCYEFGKYLKNGNLNEAKKLLGKIFLSNEEKKLDKYLINLFIKRRVTGGHLIAFKIDERNIATLRINIQYGPDRVQTYLFCFLLGGDGKIEGLVPTTAR